MRTCCVLRCRSGYQRTKEKVSLFALPSDPEMRSKWILAIARPETAKFSFSSRNVRVCEKHFRLEDIVRYDEYVIQGTAVRLERHRSKPRPHAVPRIFESPAAPKEKSTRVPRPSPKRKPLGPSRELSGTQTSQILRTCGSEENAWPGIVEVVSKPPSARGCGAPVATDIVLKTEPPDVSDDFLERVCSDTCTQDGHEHECKMCHKIFNTCLHLLQHSVVHSKELQFMCTNCGAVFLHQEDKRKHEGMHTSRQLYCCVRCGESSPNETMFRQHILEHYGQPSFDCHLCPMVFPLKQQLAGHLQTHCGEQVYDCPHCGATFRHKPSLSRHRRNRHAARRYHCRYCTKAFPRQSNVEEHERIHTGERPFSCGLCMKRFINQAALRKHVCKQLANNS